MRIKENYLLKQREIKEDPEGRTAEEVKRKAMDAVYKGVYSPEWDAFMRLFATNTSQLARLTGTDSTHDEEEYTAARAKLVANAVVGLEKTADSSFIEVLETDLDDSNSMPL